VELKIINPRDLWLYKEDSLPEKFTIQVQQQMAVMECDHGFLCAVCGTECVVRHVPRHQRLIDALHAISVQFLDLVENDVPPKIDGSDATTEVIKQQFPTVDPERIRFLTDEYNGLHERYDRYHRIEKRAGEMKAMVANRVKSAMEEAEYAVDTQGKCFSWKLGKRGRSFSRLEKTPPSVRIQRVAAEFGE
jgi:predicted phage-related endonuclease